MNLNLNQLLADIEASSFPYAIGIFPPFDENVVEGGCRGIWKRRCGFPRPTAWDVCQAYQAAYCRRWK